MLFTLLLLLLLVSFLLFISGPEVGKNHGIGVVESHKELVGTIKVRGGGHSLIWPKQVCAAQQGMVFRVLRLKQGMQTF